MARIEKTVFISYRRTNASWALAIFHHLRHHGFDVFFDFDGIASGDFASVILENIRARAHFILILTPSALERCAEPGDWLTREIETAIQAKRNIIPLMLEGFKFSTPSIARQLTGSLEPLRHYNAVNVTADYFDAAMQRLRDKFLNVALDAVLHPVSSRAQQAVKKQQVAAKAAPMVLENELTAQTCFERGFSAIDSDEQIHFYTQAIHLKPDFADAYYNRGAARSDKGDSEGALSDFDEAIRLDPSPDAYIFRGNTHRANGDLESALADFDQAIRLNPDHPLAYYNRGNTRVYQGDLEGAVADYNRAIRLNPNNVSAYYNRGRARSNQGDLKGAIADYNQAIRLNPNHVNAYDDRGLARKQQGDLKGAIADHDQAIRLEPTHVNAHYNRGGARREQGDLNGALADYKKYLDLGGGERHGNRAEVDAIIRDLKAKL